MPMCAFSCYDNLIYFVDINEAVNLSKTSFYCRKIIIYNFIIILNIVNVKLWDYSLL